MDVRGARSHGQEVLEPSVDLDAASTALPVDSSWSMLLGQATLRHPTAGPAPHAGGALGPSHPEARVLRPRLCGSGLRGLWKCSSCFTSARSPLLPSPGTLPGSATWQARFMAQ